MMNLPKQTAFRELVLQEAEALVAFKIAEDAARRRAIAKAEATWATS